MTHQRMLNEIVEDPAMSFWLKKAAADLSKRDPVDALGDAEVLLEFCRCRMTELLRQGRSS